MTESDNIIAIKILERTYKIKCPPEESQALQEAARRVEEQMRRAKSSGSVTGTDRIAILTALNMCHELISVKKQNNQLIDSMNSRIRSLQEKTESVLSEEETIA